MLNLEQMLINLLLAMALGAFIGLERELAGKEAGVRTAMLVCGGSAIFAMIALTLPYLITNGSPDKVSQVIAENAGFMNIIANIVVGIGFLGAGIIIKSHEHVHGLTTAADIWMASAIGVLVGINLTTFALASTALVVLSLFTLRKIRVSEKISKDFPGKDDDAN